MMIQYFDDRADREWLGIVPEFFARGVVAARFEGGGISTVADEMNSLYQWGGFSDHWKGDINDDGVYHNEHEKMEPSHSLVLTSTGGRCGRILIRYSASRTA
jgi:hypothetical protein